MNDDTTRDDLDDTTGHVLHGDAAEHPTTGGTAPGLLRAVGDEDDTEGHMKTRKAAASTDDEDDTEGHAHARLVRASDDDDDTQGHVHAL
jgi:hypothetical protein